MTVVYGNQNTQNLQHMGVALEAESKRTGDGTGASGGAAKPVGGGGGKADATAAIIARARGSRTSRGAAIVRDLLTLLYVEASTFICSCLLLEVTQLFCRYCSRYGLREVELLELLAPPGMSQLPHALWARLSKSLSAYTKLFETQDVSTLRFFHQQISRAVASRYLDGNKQQEVSRSLMSYFACKVRGESCTLGTCPTTVGTVVRRTPKQTCPGLARTSATLQT